MNIKSKEKTMIILAILATISIIISFSLLAQGLEKKEEKGSLVSGTMPLLAVSTGNSNEMRGGLAYLDLKIINGTGSVYVHAEPFTRVDTQATTRFAKQYACSITDIDCTQYDFLYSIRSDAPIVGGPSAGAAMTALTVTLLQGKSFPQGVSITGSISSGGIIGNVGGIDEKIEAASRTGLRTVVIPTLSNYTSNYTGNVRVVWANTIEEALIAIDSTYSFNRTESIIVPETYTQTMSEVATKLCNDNQEQYSEITNLEFPNNRRINTSITMVGDLIDSSNEARANGLHYTQASHCFNARTRLHYLRLSSQMYQLQDHNMTLSVLTEIMDLAQERARIEYEAFSQNSRTDINSIQIKSIVKERYDESIDKIGEIRREIQSPFFNMNALDDTLFEIGYTLARIDSMISWISFADYEPESPEVSQSAMRQLCNRKISEANERSEYVEYATGVRMIELTDAYRALTARNYDDCIYKASLSKARADMIMSRISTPPGRITELVTAKKDAAEHAIAQQSTSGVFPVMAYSYLEYADSLKEENPEIALLYYENAIELSGLTSYFEDETNEKGTIGKINLNQTYLFLIFLGLALGFSVSMIILGLSKEKREKIPESKKTLESLKKRKTTKKSPTRKVRLKKISKK